MAGIRLHHETVRSAVYVVETPIVYPVPYACPLCKRVELNKSIHLRVDGAGDVIVSVEVWQALQCVPDTGGMRATDTVENPPPQTIGAVAMPTQEIVDRRLNPDNDRARFYVPGRTKYESRDRIHIPRLRLFKRQRHG